MYGHREDGVLGGAVKKLSIAAFLIEKFFWHEVVAEFLDALGLVRMLRDKIEGLEDGRIGEHGVGWNGRDHQH